VQTPRKRTPGLGTNKDRARPPCRSTISYRFAVKFWSGVVGAVLRRCPTQAEGAGEPTGSEVYHPQPSPCPPKPEDLSSRSVEGHAVEAADLRVQAIFVEILTGGVGVGLRPKVRVDGDSAELERN
jgi:hypothetical protein